MRKIPLILGIISFVLAAIIFIFGTGARRVYSGAFFVILGVIMVANAKRGFQDNKNSASSHKCNTKSLNITLSLELPYDSRSDEITLQVVECRQCEFGALAVYEESRRGALDSDSFDHSGYRIAAKVLAAVRRLMQRCPRPKDPRCRCAAHRRLGSRDASARWKRLEGIEVEGAFRMIL